MTNKEILEKAIQKAIDGGYALPLNDERLDKYEIADDGLYDDSDFEHPRELALSMEAIIFNHDFAKALWGDKPITSPFMIDAQTALDCTHPTYKTQPNWQYHLQQMAIADDPIKYLGEHLDD